MAFGDVLKRDMYKLSSASENKCAKNSFWIILRDIAVKDILECRHEVYSDIAIDIYYKILCENIKFIPSHFRKKLKNKQESFRVINRNIWTSNAFNKKGLANHPQIEAHKQINPNKKGSRIVFQCVKCYVNK